MVNTDAAGRAHITSYRAGRMLRAIKHLFAGLAMASCAWASGAAAVVQTVCTITVNSSDEKEAFRRFLPPANYDFVELVERGRPDWLAASCRAGVKCDVLIISGHYDGGNEFFSDRLETAEFLPVEELERVSCSDSCPGLFSQLKEVHLYGCNTLSTEANSSVTAEVVRSLVREGNSLKEATRQLHALNAGHGESSHTRMRQVFKDVPVIYGFSSVAPLGPIAAATLGGYFRSNGAREIGKGRTSRSLLAHFAPFGMTVTQGMTQSDPHAGVRADVCKFADDRATAAHKLRFIHEVLQRDMAQTRVHLDRIQRQAVALGDPALHSPEVAQALSAIASDKPTRTKFLTFARDADQPAVRARMIRVAQDLGWLSEAERRAELVQMLGEVQARSSVGLAEIDLACTLNQENQIDGAFNLQPVAGSARDDLAHAAMRACLGSAEAQARTLQGLISNNEADVQIARAYLRHRPLTDASQLRGVAKGIVSMPASQAQVRALEALGRHYVSDREVLALLTRLFIDTASWPVQAAIAGILLRADLRAITSTELVATLQRERLANPASEDTVDALIQRLQKP
jgi:hypothetical protein